MLSSCREFFAKQRHKKIPRATGWFQEPCIDTLHFLLDKVKHGIDYPSRCEDLPMVGDALTCSHNDDQARDRFGSELVGVWLNGHDWCSERSTIPFLST